MEPILGTTTGGFDDLVMYRTAIQPHPDGVHFRIWYSAQGTSPDEWRAAYTLVPKSLWT